MCSSDSDNSSDWNRELFIAVTKKQGKGKSITEQYRCEQIQECLDQGADVNALDKHGNTVLDIAATKGYHQVVQFLRQNGANSKTDDNCDLMDCGSATLPDDLDELEIASISISGPIVQPSSSSSFLNSNIFESPKRKLTTGQSKLDEDPRKRVSIFGKPLQGESEARTDLSSEKENPSIEENQGEVIQRSCFDPEETYAASGLKRSSHGVIYQLKHLMLVLNRTWKMKYAFRLSTEMEAAEKFDDLVLNYRDNEGNEMHRFVQVKHKCDGTKTITARHLLDVKDGEFSVLKYFVSWRRIKKHKDFAGSTSKFFILCTNIGLDLEGLKEANIMVSEVQEPDEFLRVKNRRKQPPRYKLLVDGASELHETLKTASNVHQLSRILAQRVDDCKEIDLRTDIFKSYHVALGKEVIDTKTKKFSDDFIKDQNLSASGKNFRRIFFQNTKNFTLGKDATEEEVWQRLGNRSLKLSSTFGKQIKSTSVKQFTELPNDLISDQEISEFLNEFVLAVNQPNEVELGEMIKREIGADSQFNLLDADFIGDSFQSAMLDWFKEAGSCGKFLQNKDAEDFFNRIEFKLSSVITMGLSLEHPEKLKSYGVQFQTESSGLKKFMNGASSQILQFISSSQTLLTSLRVYQTLMQIRKFEKTDSFIFIQLKTLLLPEIIKRVLRAFQWPRNHNLLIIDCGATGLEKYGRILWNPLSEIMRKNPDKRMILVIQGDHDSSVRFQISYESLHENDDDISIDNLEEYSQQKLLNKKMVKFQGHDEKTSLGKLLGSEKKKSKNLRSVIGANTLVQLIQNHEIQIGNELQGLGDIQDYYIPRTIVRHVIMNPDVMRAPEVTDVFALAHVDIRALRTFLGTEGRLGSLDGNTQARLHDRECFVLTDGKEEDGFDTLCELIPHHNIHWLDGESGKMIWIKSFGNVTELVAYKDTNGADLDGDRPGATFPTEEDLVSLDSEYRIVILSNAPGMGKSTILTRLAGEMKDNAPSLLVIRVNLTQHTTALAEEMASRTFDRNQTNEAVDFLVDKLSGLDTNLESQVYKTIIKDQGEAALLFDGFDEISPTYGDTVIDLLQALAKLPIKKLFVTTRPYTSKVLEEKLGTFSHMLEPFSELNQIEFLTNFWYSILQPNTFDEAIADRLVAHAMEVLDILAQSIDQQMVEFMGVPLQTKLVAEVFQYEEVEESNLPSKLDIVDLYDRFVDKKYKIFFTEKQLGDQTNLAAIQGRDIGRKIFLKMHQKLALDALFPPKVVASLLISQPEIEGCVELFREISDCGERTGIITRVVDGVPHFVHRTFAEYFASIFLFNTLKDEKRNNEFQGYFVTDLFVKNQHRVIRAFLNCLMSRETCKPVDQPWKLDLSENLFKDHETPYHTAAEERNVEIAKFLLNRLNGLRIRGKSEDIKGEIPLVDYQNSKQYTPLLIAADSRNFKLYNSFIEGGADLNSRHRNGQTVLHYASETSDTFEMVKYLVEKGANVQAVNDDYETPLHMAVQTVGNLATVKYLVEKGSNVNSKGGGKVTPLQRAVECKGNFEIVKYLVDEGADVRAEDEARWTALHTAVSEQNNLDVVKCLIENGADFYAEAIDLMTPWGLAADEEYTRFAENYLFEKGGKIPKGYSSISRAIK